ncbi:MAG: DUF1232 domain-containing protein [Actinomycetota bacterium]
MNRIDEIPVPKRDAGQIAREAILVLPNVVKLLARLARDPRVSIRRKAFAASALVYVVSPIDIVPDFVVGFGQLDDLIIAAIAINHLIDGAGREIIEEHWDGSVDSLDLVLAAAEWGAEIVPGPLRRLLPD